MGTAFALLLLGGGVFSAYAGITGQPVVPALRSVLAGKKPVREGTAGGVTVAPQGTGLGIGAAAGAAAGGAAGAGTFAQQLQKLMGEAPGTITVTSGTRTNAQQTRLWEQALAKYGDPETADNYVARPGTSNHEKGLAADLRFANDAVRSWAHANAGRFGLVFPMSHEPWHVELSRTAVAPAGRARSQPVVLPAGVR